jgi:ABC-type lipoprotein export system ATPase subunit
MTAVIQVAGVQRSFGTGDSAVHVLRGVDLSVNAGELVALYGPSGSGKTTLLNLIGALDQPTGGDITIRDQHITALSDARRATFRRRNIAFIFQNYTLMPTYTAAENIDLGLRLLLPRIGLFERRRRAASTLEAMGLSAWADHLPDQLSGGQRQRVAIARALALRVPLVLADEPTSGLDTRTARRVLALFRGIAESQGTAFVIVSHDPNVEHFVHHIYDLHLGQLQPRAALQPQGETISS